MHECAERWRRLYLTVEVLVEGDDQTQVHVQFREGDADLVE